MNLKICILLVLTLFCARSVFAEDLPAYQATVESQIPGMKLSIDCVIQQPVSKEVLTKLAADVYKKYNGKNFENVFIMWYLPHYKIGNGAWGTTNYSKGSLSTSILALQGE